MWAIKFLGSQIILCLLFDIEKERQFKSAFPIEKSWV